MIQIRTFFSSLLLLCLPLWILGQTNPCDTIEVVAEAGVQNLTCSSPIGSISAVPHPNTIAYAWAGPNGFSSTVPTNAVTVAGVYTLTVTGPQGCTATATITVADDCDSLSFGLAPPACPNGTVSPAETCHQACVAACIFPYLGTTAPFAGDPQHPAGFCSMVQNDQWIAFLPPLPSATLRLTPSNCVTGDGVQMAVYSGCEGELIACNSGCTGCGSQPIEVELNNLTPGKVYYLMIDGYSGDQCDFLLEEISGSVCDSMPEPCDPPIITGPAQVCPGGTYTYTITPAPGCIPNGYYITGVNGMLVNNQPVPTTVYPDETGQIQVSFFSSFTGSAALGVRALKYFTRPSAPTVKFITVQPIPPTILPPVTICAEDAPYFFEACGIDCMTSGNYCCTLTSVAGCDSVVCQQVIIKAPIIRQIVRVVCEGQSVEICGNVFSQSGNYVEVCESYQGCDSTVFLNLVVLSPVAEITGGGELSCNNSFITLGSVISPNAIKRWYLLEQGAQVGQGNTMTVTFPGTYVLETTQMAAGIQCVATDTIVITGSGNSINAQIQGGELRCDSPQTTLTLQTNALQPEIVWTGPGGTPFPASATITATQPGIYTVLVTETATGCTATASFTVTGNTTPPELNASANGDINCLVPEVLLTATANGSNIAFTWSGPGISNPSGATQLVSEAGAYTVLASDPFGCTATASVTVTADTLAPVAEATASNELTCATPSVTLTGTPSGGGYVVCWIFPNGIAFTTPTVQSNTPGVYVFKVTSPNGCFDTDTLILNPNIDIPDVQAFQAPLLCGVPEMTIQAVTNVPNATITWLTPTGDILNGPSQAVTLPGTYTAVVTAPNGCTNSQAILVNGPALFPQVALSGGTLTCFAPQINLVATVNTTSANYEWEGPAGFSGTNSAVQTVTLPGIYTVTITNEFNCSATASTTVVQNITAPSANITISGPGLITCDNPTVILDGSANMPGVTYTWQGAGIILQGPTVTVSQPGVYTLLVTAPNGCTGTAVAEVLIDAVPPFVQTLIAPIDCGDTSVTLIASATPGSDVVWMGPNGFFTEEDLPMVTVPGVYIAIATAPNGCTNSMAVVVPVLEPPLTLMAFGDSITCADPLAQLNVIANIPNILYQWNGPNNFNSNLANPVTDTAGLYTVVAVNPLNGCTAIATAEVTGDCVSGTDQPFDVGAGLKVYPVPAVSWLYIELPDTWQHQETRLLLYSADGRLIRQEILGAGQQRHALSVEGLPAGHYQLNALQPDRQAVLRVMVGR